MKSQAIAATAISSEYFLAGVLARAQLRYRHTSLDEHWKTPPDQLQGTLAWANAECCVAYNLMKLERHGLRLDRRRALDGCLRAVALSTAGWGTQNAQGLKQYFFPLAAGYWARLYSAEESFWCCTGTGAEEFAKFADTIYFRRGSDIFVNQFISSTLDWQDEGLVLEQVTQFPREQGTTIKVKSSRAGSPHHPRAHSGWATEEAAVKINGRPLMPWLIPAPTLAIRRIWQPGDTVSISLPMELRQRRCVATSPLLPRYMGRWRWLPIWERLRPKKLTASFTAGTRCQESARGVSLAEDRSCIGRKREQWFQVESAPSCVFSVAGESAKSS